MNPVVNTTFPSYSSMGPARCTGDMCFDTSGNKVLVWTGQGWDEMHQSVTPDPMNLTPEEIVEVRDFLKNKEKYRQVLIEHFPEDYL